MKYICLHHFIIVYLFFQVGNFYIFSCNHYKFELFSTVATRFFFFYVRDVEVIDGTITRKFYDIIEFVLKSSQKVTLALLGNSSSPLEFHRVLLYNARVEFINVQLQFINEHYCMKYNN